MPEMQPRMDHSGQNPQTMQAKITNNRDTDHTTLTTVLSVYLSEDLHRNISAHARSAILKRFCVFYVSSTFHEQRVS